MLQRLGTVLAGGSGLLALQLGRTVAPAACQKLSQWMAQGRRGFSAELGAVDPRVPGAAQAPLPVVHSDDNKAAGGELPQSPYEDAYGGLRQHGEPHNTVWSDDHASITNEVEKLLMVADELGGPEAVFKVVDQFGEGPGWTEMNVATAFRCLGEEAAHMSVAAVKRQILDHPCFQRLLSLANSQLPNMSDAELTEIGRACAKLGYSGSELANQVLWLELNNTGSLWPPEPATTAECIAGAI